MIECLQYFINIRSIPENCALCGTVGTSAAFIGFLGGGGGGGGGWGGGGIAVLMRESLRY